MLTASLKAWSVANLCNYMLQHIDSLPTDDRQIGCKPAHTVLLLSCQLSKVGHGQPAKKPTSWWLGSLPVGEDSGIQAV